MRAVFAWFRESRSSRLLLLGAFFLHLFQIRAEQSTEVISEDKGMVSQGVIESKVLGKD